MKLQDTHKEILGLCADDYTGFWLIVKSIARDDYSFSQVPVWVRLKTIEVIQSLLQDGLIEAGYIDLTSHKFKSLGLSVAETITYIEREWDELGRTPNIGDICDFFVTPTGERLARELNLI